MPGIVELPQIEGGDLGRDSLIGKDRGFYLRSDAGEILVSSDFPRVGGITYRGLVAVNSDFLSIGEKTSFRKLKQRFNRKSCLCWLTPEFGPLLAKKLAEGEVSVPSDVRSLLVCHSPVWVTNNGRRVPKIFLITLEGEVSLSTIEAWDSSLIWESGRYFVLVQVEPALD